MTAAGEYRLYLRPRARRDELKQKQVGIKKEKGYLRIEITLFP